MKKIISPAQVRNLRQHRGNKDSFKADIIALCESWADHIGLNFAHKSYPNNYSIFKSFLELEEDTRNETTDHSPIGFYQDLTDANNFGHNNEYACDISPNSCGNIDDAVSGFSNSEMFNLLNNDTKSVTEFKNKLIQNKSSLIQQQVNDLFDDY